MSQALSRKMIADAIGVADENHPTVVAVSVLTDAWGKSQEEIIKDTVNRTLSHYFPDTKTHKKVMEKIFPTTPEPETKELPATWYWTRYLQGGKIAGLWCCTYYPDTFVVTLDNKSPCGKFEYRRWDDPPAEVINSTKPLPSFYDWQKETGYVGDSSFVYNEGCCAQKARNNVPEDVFHMLSGFANNTVSAIVFTSTAETRKAVKTTLLSMGKIRED